MAGIQKIILTIEGQRKEQVQIVLLDDGLFALAMDGVLVEVVRWKNDQLEDCRAIAYALANVEMPADEPGKRP